MPITVRGTSNDQSHTDYLHADVVIYTHMSVLVLNLYLVVLCLAVLTPPYAGGMSYTHSRIRERTTIGRERYISLDLDRASHTPSRE